MPPFWASGVRPSRTVGGSAAGMRRAAVLLAGATARWVSFRSSLCHSLTISPQGARWVPPTRVTLPVGSRWA